MKYFLILLLQTHDDPIILAEYQSAKDCFIVIYEMQKRRIDNPKPEINLMCYPRTRSNK